MVSSYCKPTATGCYTHYLSIRMLFHYPLSGFLTLFANCLQNPQDSQLSSDLELMDLVTSFFSPSLVQVSPLIVTASVIFRELGNLATEFVDMTNCHNMKKNRMHEFDSAQASSYSSPSNSGIIEALLHDNIIPGASGSTVCMLFKQLQLRLWTNI
jgi:hypothetical protein